MSENGRYQYDIVKKLSFIRWGGTAEEERAAELIADEIRALGGESSFMGFTIPAADISGCSLAVTAPFAREISAVPYGRSGNIDGEYELYYAERGTESDYLGIDDLSGKAVLINEFNYDAYKLLCAKKASAFIVFSGKWYDDDGNSDLIPRMLRPNYLKNGRIPGFVIRTRDAVDMIRDGAARVRLALSQTERDARSRDILAVIEGTEIKNESVVLTAHYDSVTVGTGSWDNATGAATLLYLYGYFLRNPPRRTMRFVWCGSEEQGLYGSHAYVDKNPELIKETGLCFNFDMCGTVLGNNIIYVTGGDELKHFAEQYCRETGHSAAVEVKVHSSDSAPFADAGIPALGISRRTNTADIHTRNDLLFPLSAKALAITGEFAAGIISRVVSSATLPVAREMPEEMKKELDKYFQRDKTPLDNDGEDKKNG